MITYDHFYYLHNAIVGVLNQECNFDFELIISDDCSPINPIESINVFKNHKNFKKIKFYRHSVNKGPTENFLWSLNQCKGEYIAQCEGDDYWIDPLKLQKQVDFLEANNNFVLCASNTRISINSILIDENQSVYYKQETILNSNNIISDFTFNPIPTATSLFRSSALKLVDFDFLKKCVMADWLLMLEMSKIGNIYFFKDFFSVYRIHENGIWSRKNSVDKKIEVIQFYLLIIDKYPEYKILCDQQIIKIIEDIITESNYKVEQFFIEKIEQLKNETNQRDFILHNFSLKDIFLILFEKIKISFKLNFHIF